MKNIRLALVLVAAIAAIATARAQTDQRPPVISVPAATGIPSDAIVLFDGANLDAWESADPANPAPRWRLEPDSRAMVVVPGARDLRTKSAFGDMQLHIEWRTPAKVIRSGQGRGNSGVFFMEAYELQILDSYDNDTNPTAQAGSIYRQHEPLVNASRAPGEWQTYDVIFTAPRFNDDDSLALPARITVFHNGALVQHHVAIRGATRGPTTYTRHPDRLPLRLQNHDGDLVAFRNIWVRELTLPGLRTRSSQ